MSCINTTVVQEIDHAMPQGVVNVHDRVWSNIARRVGIDPDLLLIENYNNGMPPGTIPQIGEVICVPDAPLQDVDRPVQDTRQETEDEFIPDLAVQQTSRDELIRSIYNLVMYLGIDPQIGDRLFSSPQELADYLQTVPTYTLVAIANDIALMAQQAYNEQVANDPLHSPQLTDFTDPSHATNAAVPYEIANIDQATATYYIAVQMDYFRQAIEGWQPEQEWSLLEDLAGAIERMPSIVFGVSIADVRGALQSFYLAMYNRHIWLRDTVKPAVEQFEAEWEQKQNDGAVAFAFAVGILTTIFPVLEPLDWLQSLYDLFATGNPMALMGLMPLIPSEAWRSISRAARAAENVDDAADFAHVADRMTLMQNEAHKRIGTPLSDLPQLHPDAHTVDSGLIATSADNPYPFTNMQEFESYVSEMRFGQQVGDYRVPVEVDGIFRDDGSFEIYVGRTRRELVDGNPVFFFDSDARMTYSGSRMSHFHIMGSPPSPADLATVFAIGISEFNVFTRSPLRYTFIPDENVLEFLQNLNPGQRRRIYDALAGGITTMSNLLPPSLPIGISSADGLNQWWVGLFGTGGVPYIDFESEQMISFTGTYSVTGQ